MGKSCFCKGIINNVDGSLYETLLVCIFYAQQKISAFMFCDQVGI